MSWACLLKRVFDIDVEHCPNYAGRLRIIAAIVDPAPITKLLTHLRLPARAPPRSPARGKTVSVMGRLPDVQAFATMLRSGKRPDDGAIAVMPFRSLSKLSDTDIAAVHAFLQTLPPHAAGKR